MLIPIIDVNCICTLINGANVYRFNCTCTVYMNDINKDFIVILDSIVLLYLPRSLKSSTKCPDPLHFLFQISSSSSSSSPSSASSSSSAFSLPSSSSPPLPASSLSIYNLLYPYCTANRPRPPISTTGVDTTYKARLFIPLIDFSIYFWISLLFGKRPSGAKRIGKTEPSTNKLFFH